MNSKKCLLITLCNREQDDMAGLLVPGRGDGLAVYLVLVFHDRDCSFLLAVPDGAYTLTNVSPPHFMDITLLSIN